MKSPARATLSALLLCVCLALAAQQTPHAKYLPNLPLVPAFDQSQHAPEFLATYKNNTSRTVDIYEMYTHSTITLDGKAYSYSYSHTVFQGYPDLRPGQPWSDTVDISEYIPGWKRLAYDKSEEAWHWQSPLKTGTHTLTLNMGGKQYGPVDFQWDEDRPFVIHSGANLAPTPLRTAATARRLPR